MVFSKDDSISSDRIALKYLEKNRICDIFTWFWVLLSRSVFLLLLLFLIGKIKFQTFVESWEKKVVRISQDFFSGS